MGRNNMDENQQINMNTTEVREFLEISNFIVNKLVKKGQLVPINKDTWRLDGSFLFRRGDVEAIKKQENLKVLLCTRLVKNMM